MKGEPRLKGCRYAQERLSAYLDGQLSARETARVERHLLECAACKEELESLRATKRLLSTAPHPRMPRPVVIPPEVQEQQRRTRRMDMSFSTLRASAIAIGVVLALLLSAQTPLLKGASQASPQAELAMAREEQGPEQPALMAEPVPLETNVAAGGEVPAEAQAKAEGLGSAAPVLEATEEVAMALAAEEGPEQQDVAEQVAATVAAESVGEVESGAVPSARSYAASEGSADQRVAVTEEAPEQPAEGEMSPSPLEAPAPGLTPLHIATLSLAGLLAVVMVALAWTGRRRMPL